MKILHFVSEEGSFFRAVLIPFLIMLILISSYPSVSFAKTDKKEAMNRLNNKMDEMEEVQEETQQVYEKLSELSKKVEKQEKEVNDIKTDIKKKSTEIGKAEDYIEKTKRDIETKKDGLNQRLRAMYKASSIGYLDVFLGSRSVEDIIANLDMVQRIYKKDQETMQLLSDTCAFTELQQEELEIKKKELQSEEEVLVKKEEKLQKMYDEVNAEYMTLKEEEERLEAEMQEIIHSNKLEIDGDTIKLISTYTGDYKWLCPVQTKYYVNKYGEYMAGRSYENHPGIDMAAPKGTPIYAAEKGIVIKAGWYGGYGKAVVISHGSGLTSLYGHNSSIEVKVGQKVDKGDVIAKMGSTGWSTGSHCHFEVRKNGKLCDPRKYAKIHGPNY